MSNAVPEQAVEAATRLIDRADSTIITDVAGNRFRKIFADDLDALKAALPFMGAQREDVARVGYEAGRYKDDDEYPPAKTWDELETLIADADYDPIWKRELVAHRDWWLKVASAILSALPHTGQPQEGASVTFCYVTYKACTASCPTREECALGKTQPEKRADDYHVFDPTKLSDGELIQCLEEMRSRDGAAQQYAAPVAEKQTEAK